MFDIAHLRQARQRLGLTQTDLAKQASVSQSLIAKIEQGRIDPKHSTVLRITEAVERQSAANDLCAKDILHKEIIAATADESVPHLVRRMQRAEISQVPVLDKGRAIGLITERDILRTIQQGHDLASLAAREIMGDSPPTVPHHMPVRTIARLLEHSPLILVQDRSRYAGVITRADLVRSALR